MDVLLHHFHYLDSLYLLCFFLFLFVLFIFGHRLCYFFSVFFDIALFIIFGLLDHEHLFFDTIHELF